MRILNNPVDVYVASQQLYLVENTKEVVRPLGSWSQSGIRTHKGVVAKWRLVNVVEGADFLIGRIFPGENWKKKKCNMRKKIKLSGMKPAALNRSPPDTPMQINKSFA